LRLSRASLGLKLNLALLLFFIVLGAATAAFVFAGFNRTRDNATARSEEALEELGKLALEALVGGATESGGLQFESAAEIGQRAARYMETVRQQSPASFDSADLSKTDKGLYYDPDPARTADLIVFGPPQLDDFGVQDELAYAAPLDAISPVLFDGFEDEVGGRNFDPNAIAFIGVNGVVHYYPPRGIHEVIPPDLDTSSLMARVGPVDNPERRTLWRSPYEDSAGQGLVVTAETPVYEGDVFRGAIQVDLLISKLIDQINGIRPTPGAFAFYVDTSGELLKSDQFDTLSREAEQNSRLASILDGMKSNTGDFSVTVETIVLDGREFFLAYAPMLSLGGSFAVAAPVDEVTDQAAAITAEIDQQADRTMIFVLLSMTALFGVALIGATYINRRVLIRPIEGLASGTRAVAQGNYEIQIAARGDDELATLARSFNAMTAEIVAARGDLERQVEERTRELTALLRISSNVASTLELRPLLRLVMDELRVIADYSRCTVYEVDGNRLEPLDSRSTEPDTTMPPVLSLAEIQPIWTQINEGRPVLIDDVRSEAELALAYQSGAGASQQTSTTVSWMGIPLSLKDRVIGMVGFSHTEARFYTERHASLVGAIASQVTVAIENARLYEQAQQLAAVEERQRLARELHDSVSQALYGIALGARTARTLLEGDPSRAIEPVDYVLALAEAGLAEMRALIFELRPESLEMEGLAAALEKQTAATKARYGIDIVADIDDEPLLSFQQKEVFYRVAQEALHNVVKHAHATRAEVRLALENGSVLLEVRDDGDGFDISNGFPGHMGLVSMRERAASIDASLDIDSTPGTGTSVRLLLLA